MRAEQTEKNKALACHGVVSHMIQLFADETEQVLYAGVGQIWAGSLKEQLKTLADDAMEQAHLDFKDAMMRALTHEVRAQKKHDQELKYQENDIDSRIGNQIKKEIENKYKDKIEAASQTYFLKGVMRNMLEPYYNKLQEAGEKKRKALEKSETSKKDAALKVKVSALREKLEKEYEEPVKKELTELNNRFGSDDRYQYDFSEGEKKIKKEWEDRIETQIDELRKKEWKPNLRGQKLFESKVTQAIHCDSQVIEINEKIKNVKMTINRALQAYNKSLIGQENPFMPRIVALSSRAGEGVADFFSSVRECNQANFPEMLKRKNKKLHALYETLSPLDKQAFFELKDQEIDEKMYEKYLKFLSQDLLEEEWLHVTHSRLSFELRLEAEKEKWIKEKYQETDDRLYREAKIRILVKSYQKEANPFLDRSYVLVNYEDQALLEKAKNKWKKNLSFWLRLVISSVVGLSEGLVAGYAIFGLLSALLGPAAPIAIGLAIFVGISGAAVNMPTLFNDAIEPFKNLFNGRLLGEPGAKLKGADRNLAIGLIVSTFGYGLALGIFTVAALMGVAVACLGPTLPIALMVAIGVVAVFAAISITSLFLNVATKFVKNGGLQKLKDVFDFRRIKQAFFESHPNMPTAAKWAAFLFFKVFMERILGSALIIGTLYGFCLGTGSDALSFGSRVGMSTLGGCVLGALAIVFSAVIFGIFSYDKLSKVFNAMKKALYSEEGIFHYDKDKKLHFNGINLAKIAAKGVNSLALAVVKLVVFSISASLVLVVSLLAFLTVGIAVALYKGIRSQVDKKYKESLQKEKVEHHETMAVSKRTSNTAIKEVFAYLLALVGLANGLGQGALSGKVAIFDDLGPLGPVTNTIAGSASFAVSTVSSTALNAGGNDEALTEAFGGGMPVNSWSELSTLIKNLAFALVHVFAKHAKPKDQQALARNFGLLKAPTPQLEHVSAIAASS